MNLLNLTQQIEQNSSVSNLSKLGKSKLHTNNRSCCYDRKAGNHYISKPLS